MKRKRYMRIGVIALVLLVVAAGVYKARYLIADMWVVCTSPPDTAGGWVKYSGNPVLGQPLGTCFDPTLLKEDGRYRMYFSWKRAKGIGLVESEDGIHWSDPVLALPGEPRHAWEERVNRQIVIKKGGVYHMWYTGQSWTNSAIGYATSRDGRTFTRMSDKPVLKAEAPWEGVAMMCPHVIWDDGQKVFRMWFSAGGQVEPDAIGYATSPDGLNWTRYGGNPIFVKGPAGSWECDKVTGCQIVVKDGWHYMFYIGFSELLHSGIGLARSRDGIHNWERHWANPIISPGLTHDSFDNEAAYKPYALCEDQGWRLWYNGRTGWLEQIGVASLGKADLGFDRR